MVSSLIEQAMKGLSSSSVGSLLSSKDPTDEELS